MDKQRLLDLAGITEAKYLSPDLKLPELWIVKVTWVSEDYNIPVSIVGPFGNIQDAKKFGLAVHKMDSAGDNIYDTEISVFGFDFDPDQFLEELREMQNE